MKNKIETVVSKLLQLWNEGEVSVIDEFFAPTFTFLTPEWKEARDLNAFKEWRVALHNAYSQFNIDFLDVIEEEPKFVLRWRLTGHHTGMLGNIPPTHRWLELPGVTLFEMKDDRIVNAWWFYDRQTALVQLGLIPEAEEVTDAPVRIP